MTSIFRYSKNYGSLTHETRINDAVNMEDLICLLATVRTLKRLVMKSRSRDKALGGGQGAKLLGLSHIKKQNRHSESPLFFFWGFFFFKYSSNFFLPSVFFFWERRSRAPMLPWISKPCSWRIVVATRKLWYRLDEMWITFLCPMWIYELLSTNSTRGGR